MRHLLSVLLALVLAPVVYICAGFAAAWFGEATARGDTDVVKALLGAGAAMVAGAFFAVLVMSRVSPVGPGLAGLLLLGLGGWSIGDHSGFVSTVPGTLLGVNNVLHAATPFGTSLLAVPLLATILSPRRWRRHPESGPSEFGAAPVYPPAPGSAAPAYGTPSAATPSYLPSRTDQPSVVAGGYATTEAPIVAATPLTSRQPYQPPSYSDSSTTFSGFTPTNSAPNDDDDSPRSRFH